ncbi:arginine deiminase [Rickettsiales bacterium LUAb2]
MINVYSEIGKLKEVLLHRPNSEIENLTPDLLERLLFDDIPFLTEAQKEHDHFANILRNKGVKVMYTENLASDALKVSSDIKKQFILQYLQESKIQDNYIKEALLDYLLSLSEEKLIDKSISGIRKNEIKLNDLSLASKIGHDYPFFCDPMPNVLFTRDPFSCIGNGVAINTMYKTTRKRETILAEYIFKHHPIYKNTHLYYNRHEISHIEGGDILVLNENTLAIGISQRTEAAAIDKIANNLFKQDTSFKQILAFEIPSKRAFMHLDTVFTQIDFDKFTIHSEAEDSLNIYKITPSGTSYSISQEEHNLSSILSKTLDKKVTLIKCGNGDIIASKREQWNDGANTLTISPGEVIVYNRNTITNKLLRDAGIIVNETLSGELSRGRGGPRCMSMPFIREKI